jgi:hypothetical protein
VSCQNCAEAADKRWHGFTADCIGCRTRALAVGLDRFHSMQAKKITPDYETALRWVFGDDWKEGALAVRAEAERIKGLQEC